MKHTRIVLAKYAGDLRTALKFERFRQLVNRKGARFAVFSSYGPHSRSVNKKRHGKLIQELQKRGYRHETVIGKWEEDVDGRRVLRKEKSVLVENIPFKEAKQLSRKFRQEAFVYKNKQGVLAMYYMVEAQAVLAMDKNLQPDAEIGHGVSRYTSVRGGVSFDFNFRFGSPVPWTGAKPIKRSQVQEWVSDGVYNPELKPED